MDLDWPSPASRARTMASARSATCSLVKVFDTWLRTVARLSTHQGGGVAELDQQARLLPGKVVHGVTGVPIWTGT